MTLDQVTRLTRERARIDTELAAAVRRLLEQGHTVSQVARALGVTRQAVWQRYVKHNGKEAK